MPRIIEKTVYSFDELDDKAKERAREWFREGNLDYDWWEFIYEDAVTCGAILGIEIGTRSVRLMGGGTNQKPAIQFSGFWSQGDGASFEGNYYYAKGCAKKIRVHAPSDTELHRIADCLATIQKQAGYGLTAAIKQRGNYSHSHTMIIDVEHSRGWNVELWEAQLTQLIRDFADWIYRQLEKEYEYQQADEQVDESIRANEYEFTESGKLAH